jgi:nitroimidazol reductase NimA-like FMN-containing flavoprotein (pyridoxamine 5'-phosphate oxidase superfamily)
MILSKKSKWPADQIVAFLETSEIPLRLSFLNKDNDPQICSLWYRFDDEAMWAAAHKNSFLVKQLKHQPQVAFEVSTNDYPYKGVRGKATVELSMGNAGDVLATLISKYLGRSNSQLSSWLMSRCNDEYAIKITPTFVSSWDFSDRMEK